MHGEDDVRRVLEPHLPKLAAAMWAVHDDLDLYRKVLPKQVRGWSPRGRCNWIHEQAWRHLTVGFQHCKDVEFPDLDTKSGRENETKRELVWLSGRYRMRVKQHRRRTLAVSYFPTRAGEAFHNPQRGQLAMDMATGETFTPLNLSLGYTFDEGRGNIDRVLVSRRQGRKVLWAFDLGDSGASGAVVVRPSTTGGPPATTVLPQETEQAKDVEQARDVEREG